MLPNPNQKNLFYDTLLTVKRQITLNQKIVNLALFCFSNIDEKSSENASF